MAISHAISAATNWPLISTEGLLPTLPVTGGSTATIVCKTGQYSTAIGQAVSVESLLLIVVERYIAIVRPFQSVLITRPLRITLLSLTWIFTLLIAFPYVWTSQIIETDGQTNCRMFVKWNEIEKSVFYGVGFMIFYVVPLVVTIVLYSRIVKSLNQSRQTLEGEQPDQQKLRRIHEQNHVVMKTFLLIISTYFICWTPLCVYNIIVLRKTFRTPLFPTNSCQVYVVMFFYLFPSLSMVANPIILFLSSTRFSVAFKEMFNCFTRNSPLCCVCGYCVP